MDLVNLVIHQGQIAAIVGRRRIHLAPRLDDLLLDDPVVSFVTWMAAYAVCVRDGTAPGPYTDERAERFARFALIDCEEFARFDGLGVTDDLLAGHFAVPVEQVAKMRVDLQRLA